jgi:hypothetical protein
MDAVSRIIAVCSGPMAAGGKVSGPLTAPVQPLLLACLPACLLLTAGWMTAAYASMLASLLPAQRFTGMHGCLPAHAGRLPGLVHL